MKIDDGPIDPTNMFLLSLHVRSGKLEALSWHKGLFQAKHHLHLREGG